MNPMELIKDNTILINFLLTIAATIFMVVIGKRLHFFRAWKYLIVGFIFLALSRGLGEINLLSKGVIVDISSILVAIMAIISTIIFIIAGYYMYEGLLAFNGKHN
jgi:hypothetical protein